MGTGYKSGMSRLILFRHAKTESESPSGLDRDRPLTPRGWTDAPVVAQELVRAGFIPDRILVSPARRAQETWSAMSPLFPGCLPTVVDDLYLADLSVLLDHAEAAVQFSGTTMMIGHNPGLHHLADRLYQQGTIDEFPTSAAAVFVHNGGGWVLEALLTPKGLRHSDVD